MRARKAVRRALQNQMEGRGFSFVEVLSACPTGWKATPQEAIQWVENQLMPIFPVGVYKESAGGTTPHSLGDGMEQPLPATVFEDSGASRRHAVGSLAKGELRDEALKISGFGGQGVLFTGIAMAEAGMREGLQVSWIPSYGPEMRGGTAHCHVRLALEAIASPLINRPSTLLAFNEPSMERFAPDLLPGGLLLLNSSMILKSPERSDIKVIMVPATELAHNLGNPKVANMVMIGAYLEETHALDPESILAALSEHGMKSDILALNRRALEAGRQLVSTPVR
jgi:2-oxoisovalerate ferredoxin oxidoreductase beta subunit